MSTENVNIKLSTEADLRGFKQVETAAQKLNKTVKTLATTIGVAYGAKAVANFGKEAVKAFAADQAAATKLANAVKNLGLAYANPEITKFIANLEKSSGIVDETLRPAFQALLTTTKDLGTSYTLLNDAIDISRGSGIDLATVTQDLANGYVGITRGLKKYNTGLTQAQLKTKSFAEIVAILNKEYSGASAAYLDTYAGKIDTLTVAVDNAKESIGKGLIDAFGRLSGGSTTQDAVKSIESITSAINGLVTAVSVVVEGLVKLYKGLDFITSFGGLTGANGKIVQKLKPQAQTQTQTAVAKTQIKASTALTKAQKTNTAELKKQAALKKAGTVFDMEQIQLVAALKGKLSEDEKTRAEAQLALLNGNVDLAKKLTDQILQAQDSTGNLAKFLATLPDAKNPFAYLDAYLNGLAQKAAALALAPVNPSTVTNLNPSNGATGSTDTGSAGFFTTLASQGAGASGGFSPVVAAAMAAGPTAPVVNVTVQGSIIKEQELIDLIQNGTQLASLSGSPSQIGRIAGMFG
jgi:hypothetical protein